MSDELRIPMPGGAMAGRAPMSMGYRPRRGGGGMRPLMIAAAALGGVMLLGMGGWAVMGRKPVSIPVIEADSRPLRVKPDFAGGMQIAGAEEQVLGGSSTGVERMAPMAEAPAPQALRAQMQQSAAAAAPPATVVEGQAAPVVTLATPAAPGVSPLPDTPVRPQSAVRAQAPAKPAAAASAGGAMMVQLAAVDTEAAAQSEWTRLAKRMPDLLGTRKPVVQKAERDGHAVWRIRTGGFADMADATGFCAKVRAKGGSCAVASF